MLIVSILRYYSNDDYVHHQNMIFNQIVITNIREKLQKLSFMFINKINKIHKNERNAKILESSQFYIMRVASFKISNPDNVRAN